MIFKGRFDIEVRDCSGLLVDSRVAHNIVTADGVNAILGLFAGGSTYVGAPEGNLLRASHVALGVGGTYPIVRADAWTDSALGSELLDTAYARSAFAANSATISIEAGHDDPSTIEFVAEFTAPFVDVSPGTRLIDEVGLFDAATVGNLLAVSTFPEITITPSVGVTVHYTISLSQAV